MLHARFTIRWPDGQHVTAELAAESAEAEYPVTYSGTISRLIDPPAQADVPFLTFVMRKSAEQTGGTFAEEISGTFDRWSGGPGGL